jgi:lauroyl/myristoyl acyltransferase
VAESRAGRLLRTAESVAYWAAVAPAAAYLPAALGYRIACLRGDWEYRNRPEKRAEIMRNLGRLSVGEPGPDAEQRLTRQWFRFASCEVIDVMRLRFGAAPLRRLVEIRGRVHLEAALAGGKGAILCSAHFGSHSSAFSVLHASGIPVTSIGRWWYKYQPGISPAEQWIWERYLRPVRRNRQRPNIEPWPGRREVAALAAAALRANEVVTITIDAPPLKNDQARAVEVPFLGRRARLLPGAAVLAEVTGAPLLMGFVHRSADYCHQVLEISAPILLEGESAGVFERCVAEVSAAILQSPAHWETWCSTTDLVDLGLVPPPRAIPSMGIRSCAQESSSILDTGSSPSRNSTSAAAARHGVSGNRSAPR